MASHHGELASQAAVKAGHREDGNATSEALSAVALALLDIAEAIREASRKD